MNRDLRGASLAPGATGRYVRCRTVCEVWWRYCLGFSPPPEVMFVRCF